MKPIIELSAYECPVCHVIYSEKHIMMECFSTCVQPVDGYFCHNCGTGYDEKEPAEECCNDKNTKTKIQIKK